MFAARVQDRQHHKVGIREEPLLDALAGRFHVFAGRLDLLSGSLRRARDKSEMLAASHAAQVLQANPREARNLLRGEDLLARFDDDAHLASPIAAHSVLLDVDEMLLPA